MGNARTTIYRNGQKIDVGYDVEDVCNEDDCPTNIDRGAAYLCGETPGGDEYGCGGYFCAEHLYISLRGDEPQMCGRCTKAADAQVEESAPASIR